MEIKGFITHDNIYYESAVKLEAADVEVSARPTAQHIWNGRTWITNKRTHANTDTSEESHFFLTNRVQESEDFSERREPTMTAFKAGIMDNITWKDMITVIYFLAGFASMWFHMSERILLAEQRLNIAEKENAELKITVKEDFAKSEQQFKSLNATANELSMLIIRRTK